MVPQPTTRAAGAATSGDPPPGSAGGQPPTARRLALLVGCPGSGRGVLAELLAGHPQARLVADAGIPWPSPGDAETDRLDAGAASPECRAALHGWAADNLAPGLTLLAPRAGAVRLPFLRAVFPEARLLHVVRDGRDVARALEPVAGHEAWTTVRPPGWAQIEQRADGLVRCALLWREVVELLVGDLDGVEHLVVGFEDLLERPAEVRQRALAHLALPDVPDDGWATAGEIARGRGEPQQYAPRRWRGVALERPSALRAANGLIADLLERLGYDPWPPEIAGPADLEVPRWMAREHRRLAHMIGERDLRIAELEERVAELEQRFGARQAAAAEQRKRMHRAANGLEKALDALARAPVGPWWRLAGALGRVFGGRGPEPPVQLARRRIEAARELLAAKGERGDGAQGR